MRLMPQSPAAPEPALEIDDLHVSVAGREILRGVSLSVAPSSVHALMGPNGSGKSTLANTLLANPVYEVTSGRILLAGEDITKLPTDERAARGLFLGFQHPEEIPGVSVFNFLRQAMSRRNGIDDFSIL
jgi:Fe-S cluster assembly ATP-binding protein